MASRVGNQLYHLCKMPEVVTANFLEVVLEPGWQPAGKLPAGCQPGSKITLKKLSKTISEP